MSDLIWKGDSYKIRAAARGHTSGLSTMLITVWNPQMKKIVDSAAMSEISGSGIYYYDINPGLEGDYTHYISCATAGSVLETSGSFRVSKKPTGGFVQSKGEPSWSQPEKDALDKKLESIIERIDKLDGIAKELAPKQEIIQLHESFELSRERDDAIEKKVDESYSKLNESLNSRLQSLESHSNTMDEKLDKLDKNMASNLKLMLYEQGCREEAFNVKLNSIREDVDSKMMLLNKQVSDGSIQHDKRILSLDGKVTSNEELNARRLSLINNAIKELAEAESVNHDIQDSFINCYVQNMLQNMDDSKLDELSRRLKTYTKDGTAAK